MSIFRSTSDEMLELRKLEAYLAPPPAAERSEDDLGVNRDPKGATHYDRTITLRYKSVADIQPTLDALPNRAGSY